MKLKALRCEDYMEWLKNEEEYLLYCLDNPCIHEPERVQWGEELQIVRELKDMVSKHEQ